MKKKYHTTRSYAIRDIILYLVGSIILAFVICIGSFLIAIRADIVNGPTGRFDFGWVSFQSNYGSTTCSKMIFTPPCSYAFYEISVILPTQPQETWLRLPHIPASDKYIMTPSFKN